MKVQGPATSRYIQDMERVESPVSTTYRWSKSSYDCNHKIIEEISTSNSPSECDSTSTRTASDHELMAPLLEKLKLKLLDNARRINQMQNFIQDLVNTQEQSIKPSGSEHQHETLDIGHPAIRTLPKDVRDRLKKQIMARKAKKIKNEKELKSIFNRLQENLNYLGNK